MKPIPPAAPAVLKTRRGDIVYESNPFLKTAVANTNRGVKRITSQDNDRMLVVSEKSGEVLGGAGFWQTKQVDKTQFIKLYINGVKGLADLTSAGTKLFGVLYMEMQKQMGVDQIFLSHTHLDKAIFPDLSPATFSRGVRELKDKNFIAPMVTQGWFFVNPDFIWNGDRLAFVQEYRLRDQDRAPAPGPVEAVTHTDTDEEE
jgi:hypothetical protein